MYVSMYVMYTLECVCMNPVSSAQGWRRIGKTGTSKVEGRSSDRTGKLMRLFLTSNSCSCTLVIPILLEDSSLRLSKWVLMGWNACLMSIITGCDTHYTSCYTVINHYITSLHSFTDDIDLL